MPSLMMWKYAVFERLSWPRSQLGREIAVLLAIKFVLLMVLFFLFFGPGNRPEVTDAIIHERLMSPTEG